MVEPKWLKGTFVQHLSFYQLGVIYRERMPLICEFEKQHNIEWGFDPTRYPSVVSRGVVAVSLLDQHQTHFPRTQRESLTEMSDGDYKVNEADKIISHEVLRDCIDKD